MQSLYSYESFIERHSNGRLRYHVAMVILNSLPLSFRIFSFSLIPITSRILSRSWWEGGMWTVRWFRTPIRRSIPFMIWQDCILCTKGLKPRSWFSLESTKILHIIRCCFISGKKPETYSLQQIIGCAIWVFVSNLDVWYSSDGRDLESVLVMIGAEIDSPKSLQASVYSASIWMSLPINYFTFMCTLGQTKKHILNFCFSIVKNSIFILQKAHKVAWCIESPTQILKSVIS